MTEKQAEQAQEILDELKELRKIDELLTNAEYRNYVNVTFNQHYGKNPERVHIKSRHFHKFRDLLKQVISDVEQELHML